MFIFNWFFASAISYLILGNSLDNLAVSVFIGFLVALTDYMFSESKTQVVYVENDNP